MAGIQGGRGSGGLPAEAGGTFYRASPVRGPWGGAAKCHLRPGRPSGSQVLRGTAGLALGFRDCDATPVKPCTALRTRGQERPH